MDAGGAAPTCEIFDWQGRELPEPSMFEGLQMRAQIPFVPKKSPTLAVPPGTASLPPGNWPSRPT